MAKTLEPVKKYRRPKTPVSLPPANTTKRYALFGRYVEGTQHALECGARLRRMVLHVRRYRLVVIGARVGTDVAAKGGAGRP